MIKNSLMMLKHNFDDVEAQDSVEICFQSLEKITYSDTDDDGKLDDEVNRMLIGYEFVSAEH